MDFCEHERGDGSSLCLDCLAARFVALHAGAPRQRSAEWLARKSTMIGGSEVAALMGMNPYATFEAVVAAKAGLSAFGGGVACWWGTLFESAIERFVEVDCGTRLVGTDISVPAPPGPPDLRALHANSPDGYGVVSAYGSEPLRLLATDRASRAAAEGLPVERFIALFEFKCPYRRRPTGAVPRHYRPQLWSGLALSPVARRGVFVDAAFRKCALWALGGEPGFDREYHRDPAGAYADCPVAWGLTAVYAPRLDAPRARAPTAAKTDSPAAGPPAPDAAYEAWLLYARYFGAKPESPAEAARAGRPFAPDPVDFGDCAPPVFDAMMALVDRGAFRTAHCGPCFPDGRGAPLGSGRAVGAAVDRLAAAPPEHCYLLGVIPWKVCEVVYALVERRAGFLAELAPLAAECLAQAARVRAAADPAAALAAYQAERRARLGAPPEAPGAVGAADLQALFDAVLPAG